MKIKIEVIFISIRDDNYNKIIAYHVNDGEYGNND